MNFARCDRRNSAPLKPIYTFWVFVFLATLTACTSTPKVEPAPAPPSPPPVTIAPVVPPATPPPEVFGPPLPPDVKSQPTEAPKVALVLGGAGIASLATVGLLQRFKEAGVQVDYIVATGWPALFALAYGYMRTLNDVEWYAMRLEEKDFFARSGLFDRNRNAASHERLSKTLENTFPQHDLAETRVPVYISTANTEPGETEIYDKGDWKAPLLKTMSMPGIYRPYPETGGGPQGMTSLQGIDVDDAVRRGSKVIIAVEMYDDYFTDMKTTGNSSDAVFRKAYFTQIKRSMAKEMKLAQLTGRIQLGKPSADFSLATKRQAIREGYQEGAKLVRELRALTVN